MTTTIKFTFLAIIFAYATVSGQDKSGELAKATNFCIPSSPAFNLLDVNPTSVNKPGFARDFKFDWISSSGALRPDIAIEAQPVWLFFFDKTSRSEYKRKNGFVKVLSTLNTSLGTVDRDSIRSLAYSVKLTLWKAYDPIEDDAFVKDLNITLTAREEELEKQKAVKSAMLSIETDSTKAELLREQIRAIDVELETVTENETERIRAIREDYAKEHWNDSFLDLGFGQVFNYTKSEFDELDLKSDGVGVWLNGNVGVGKRAMITVLAKYLNVGDDILFLGSNFRYGNPKANFFVEFTAQMQDENVYVIAYGGDYKVNEKIQLEFGLRTNYDSDFSFFKLRPVVNLNYRLGNAD